jgi:uncharacterized membrane protein YeaQ/YmgE (transglycosylase-associated protein family)
MDILAWIALGALAGLLASMLARGRELGLLWSVGVGVVGALVGGLIMSQMGGFLGALIGASVLLLISHLLTRGRYVAHG